MSVGLKNTLVSRRWLAKKEGPLKVVVSRKSIEEGSIVCFREIDVEWLFRRDMKWENSSREWGQIPQMSSRYL